MKKIADILSQHKYAIIWTACYVFMMKFILATLFNFNIFSGTQWVRLAHSHLHGFGGMVFGILILAAVPMYAATTAIILRTKKPLFTIPVPKFITRAFAPPPPPSEPAAPAPDTSEETAAAPETFPDGMPTELRGAFRRARRGGRVQISVFDNSHIVHTPAPVLATTSGDVVSADDFPLPTDFDTGDEDDQTDAAPNFTEINFDDTPTDTPAPVKETKTDSAPATPATAPNADIITRLSGARADGEFIIYKDNIIAVHNDPDFWIADDTDWFATGKQRPSPVTAVRARAAELNLTPALYLAETNILDLDARIATWEQSGVRVIKDLADLNNLPL